MQSVYQEKKKKKSPSQKNTFLKAHREVISDLSCFLVSQKSDFFAILKSDSCIGSEYQTFVLYAICTSTDVFSFQEIFTLCMGYSVGTRSQNSNQKQTSVLTKLKSPPQQNTAFQSSEFIIKSKTVTNQMKRLYQFSPHPLMMSNREQVGKNENSTHLMMIP